LGWLALTGPTVAVVAATSVVRHWVSDLPRVPDLDLWESRVPRTSTILANDGTLLAEIPFRDGAESGYRALVDYDDMPSQLVQALLAAEDIRFFSHQGVDPRAVVRAAIANFRAGRVVEGASTIPQQVARNLLKRSIGSERKIRRKVREAVMARRLSRLYSKERLLETYANHAFLGANAYGVSAAALAYFDKEVQDLSLAESALIAGLAQAPGRANPYLNMEAARARRDEVLTRMRRADFIDNSAFRAAHESPIALSPRRSTYGTIAPWGAELARRRVQQRWPEAYSKGGLVIETSIDPVLSAAAEKAAVKHTANLANENGEQPEVAALVLDRASQYVRAVVGGNDWTKSQFDRVTQACRQPGSVFKPIVYAAALARDTITPGTPLRDGPITVYDDRWNTFWKPTNSGRSFRGVALAHDALVSSLNAPAVDVLDRVGAPAVIEMAKTLGISTKMTNVRPLALGSSCVFPMELTRVYATLANGGHRFEPKVLTRVRHQKRVYLDERAVLDSRIDAGARVDRVVASLQETYQILDPGTSFMLASMLADVVRRGTATDAKKLPWPVAGKTGTTNGNTDAWFIGFSGHSVASVWLGHDDPAKALGPRRDGARAALPLWMKLVELADKGRPEVPLLTPPPAGLTEVAVDRETGLLAAPRGGGGLSLYFRDGTAPLRHADRSLGSEGLRDTLKEF